MRVLLDECLPKRLGRVLQGHTVRTVQQEGWAGLKNGALLVRIIGRFEAFITIDRNLPAQQNLANIDFLIIALTATSNRFETLQPFAPAILRAITTGKTGEIVLLREQDL